MRIEEISRGQILSGVEPDLLVTVVIPEPISEGNITLVYRLPDGSVKTRFVDQGAADSFQVAQKEIPWKFDGNGESFKLAAEAQRIDLAFLFDPMMAVHTANVEPLPHQITAVYECMLPQQPLRFVLADDPGAGKTIMAGLYIRELHMRADAHRVLIVAPGSLVEQWRDELYEKFGMEFKVYVPAMDNAPTGSNPFEHTPLLIVRLDQMSRNLELQEKLCNSGWDLVVFDEAHKLSAHYFGSKLDKTSRFQFAERIGAHTRHLLLMTATPHNGKTEDFELFLSLLDSDRFYGKFRGDGPHKVNTSDLMRRMVKEELVKFDGKRLFPQRKAYTVNYKLSDLEVALYEAVTQYVQEEMGKADQLDGARKNAVGFALTTLQRRLASSPEAIFQSLYRRRERLEKRLREEKIGERGRGVLAETLRETKLPHEDDLPEDDDDLNAEQQENLEEEFVDQATAAKTIAELENEIKSLQGLEIMAKELVASGQDRKWEELSRILQNDPEMNDANGLPRKIIIFSEHRHTLNYLFVKISDMIGNPEAVACIHGGTHRDERRKIQTMFRSDPRLRVLIATDAAGEGVNLQNANLMVNYDLPWNPNRLEQRFGRIHRIGQTQVCHLWNLVAKETREGDVYHRLLEKLRVAGDALNGRIFDILGEVFEDSSLKQLMLKAIQYGDSPEVIRSLHEVIDHNFDPLKLKNLLNRNALEEQTMSADRLFAVKDELDKAEARRLQPFYVRSFFLKAAKDLGISVHAREKERMEVTFVPSAVRERDRRITGRNRRDLSPVLERYQRICFTKDSVRPIDDPSATPAELIHPGHPLMMAMTDLILERYSNLLRQGVVMVDPSDEGDTPRLLVILSHEVHSGNNTVLSKRMQFIEVTKDGKAAFAGWAPHLDLKPINDADLELIKPMIQEEWLKSDLEQAAIALAASTLVPDHFKEVADRRISHVDRTLEAVHQRLTQEIDFLQDRYIKLLDDRRAGVDVARKPEDLQKRITDLQDRLEKRKKELNRMRVVYNGTPVALGGALIIPAGLIRKLRGDDEPQAPDQHSVDPEARKRIEMIAMEAVRKAEESRGCTVVDVSGQKCGWDLTSYPPVQDGNNPIPRHIEVKGRIKGASHVTVTRNEMLYALNQAEKFVLAIVMADENGASDGPHYVRGLIRNEPEWGESSRSFEITKLLQNAQSF